MRILIADDEPATRAVVRRVLLRHFPCEVSEVDNGLDVLERLAAAPHSLLILDYKMPLMNGLETLRAIRGHQRTADLPVFMMTGITDEHVVREAVALNVTDYIIKPVRPAVIVERVARIAASLDPITSPQARTPKAIGAPVRLLPGTRVLLVDGSSDFAQVFREALGPEVRLSVAATGVDALRQHLTEPFDVVFLGADTGLLGVEELVSKFRHGVNGGRMAVVRILPAGVAARRRDAELFDGVLQRTFQVHPLREAIDQLSGESTSTQSVVSHLPNLRLMALAAVEEASSQALDAAVAVRDVPRGLPPAGLEAACHLTLDHPDVSSLTVSLLVSRRSAVGLTARLRKIEPEAVAPEELTVGLAHLTGLIGARLTAGLAANGLAALTADQVSVEPTNWVGARAGHAVALQVNTRPAGLAFRLTIRGEARVERAAQSPAA